MGAQAFSNLRFADGIDLGAEDTGQLQELTDELCSSSQRFGLKINVEKTKVLTVYRETANESGSKDGGKNTGASA